MRYGICPLSLVPVYESPDAASAMLTQLLYGEAYKLLEARKKWGRIRTEWDGTEGWIRADQHFEIGEAQYKALDNDRGAGCASDLVDHTTAEGGLLQPILLGSETGHAPLLEHRFEGSVFPRESDKAQLVPTALLYLNSPERAGGRSPFGIDAGGLAQMVYKCCGVRLSRTPDQQASQGEALSFIEESTPGDLAFFDGPDGSINHVGIIMQDNYIIHAFGKVRIDRLDHSGIFNNDLRLYTHPLRVIKKIL